MDHLFGALRTELVDPNTVIGAFVWALVFTAAAMIMTATIRKTARRLEPHLSDRTGLHFLTALAQLAACLITFVLYAHLVPELRALGTALLAGVSVVSIIVGLAAQNTLGNLVAGISLVLYRPIRVGDKVQINSPKGLMTAMVENVSLGYTVLRDADGDEVIVPNSVMVSTVVIRLGQAPATSDLGERPR